MDSELIRIDELRLRIPGLTEHEARRLGQEIARRVAEELPPESRTERLSLLELRIPLPTGVPKDRLAARIAQEIVKKLQ